MLPRRILATLAGACLLAAALVVVSLRLSYDQYTERAAVTSANLAEAMQQSIGADLDRVDLALSVLARERAAQLSGDATVRLDLDWMLAHVPLLAAIRIVDANGVFVAGTQPDPGIGTSVADRAYFQALRDGDGRDMIISSPDLGRVTGKWRVVLARRVTRPDGSFGGIISGPLPLEAVISRFSRLNVGKNGAVSLRAGDLSILARYPEQVAGADLTGNRALSRELQAAVAANPERGSYQAVTPVDGHERILSYRRIAGRPLTVLVGLSRDDYLAEWREQSAKMLALLAAFIVASSVLVVLMLNAFRVRAEALERAKTMGARLNAILSQIPLGVCIVTRDRIIRMANARLAELFGIPGADMAGLSTRQFYGSDGEFQNMGAEAYPAVARGEIFSAELPLHRHDGSPFWCRLHGRAISLDDPDMGAVWVFEDISERRCHDQEMAALVNDLKLAKGNLEQSNADLEQFAYVASHDLRQPLRMVSMYLGLIERKMGGLLDGELREFFDFAAQGARRMDRLILDLLEYSRIGRDAPPFAPVDLAEIAQEARHNLMVAIDEAQGSVVVKDGLPTVPGDRTELIRLLQNLIGNAVKYRAEGRPPRVEIGATRQGGDWLVWVKDNGIGIAPDDRERAFAIFQRVGPRDAAEGTGIGLSICRKIVHHHGGHIWVEGGDDEDGGSTFFFTLPATAA
jgi:PAS domain S-box-containing protein